MFFTFSLKVENPFKAVTHRLEKMFYELNYVFENALHHSFIKLYIVGVKALIVRGGGGITHLETTYCFCMLCFFLLYVLLYVYYNVFTVFLRALLEAHEPYVQTEKKLGLCLR